MMLKYAKKNLRKKLTLYLGIFGLFLIILAQTTNFLRIKPIYQWYTSMMWYGYILIIDSAVYIFGGNSYIMNRPKKLFTLAILSVFFWLIFEFYNVFLKGWYYAGIPMETWMYIPYYFAISTILPAVFVTMELIMTLGIFRKTSIKKIKMNTSSLYLSISIGLLMIIVPFLYQSPYFWVLVWMGFILLLDPINYIFHEKSLIGQIKSGKLTVVLSLFVAGYLCGFFWELWNYRANAKWFYTVPILDQIKVFEIPFLGFFAYGFFAWELYTMYYFAKLLIPKTLEIKLQLR